jgi:pimeloyl-ACP methyl ester carboxylesterase
MQGVFEYGGLKLEYLRIGNGSRVRLCFHGFGRPASDFEAFRELLKEDEALVCISLFGHGGSVFPAQRIIRSPLEPDEWRELLEAFLQQMHIGNFGLVGYSMGGRVAMMTCLALPSRVESMLLLAPDGFRINPLYRFASGTAVGRALSRYFTEHPRVLFGTAKLLNRSGLLSDKLYRFVHLHLDTRAKRQQVYEVWLIYRRMFPDASRLADETRAHRIRVVMIFGRFDAVIRPVLGERFLRRHGDRSILHILEIGHRLIAPHTIAYIREKDLW